MHHAMDSAGGDDPSRFPRLQRSESLQQIGWDEWFEAFDANGLALVYQDRTADGARSNFNKLVSRDTAESRSHGESHASTHPHSGEHRHDSRS